MSGRVRRQTVTKVEWTGNPWDLHHAISFYQQKKWTLAFAANWLSISEKDFWELATEACPTCLGEGRVWRNIEVEAR